MNATIQDRLQEIEAACRRHRVRRLELFGSAADGDSAFKPASSDFDFLVEFLPLGPGEAFDAYFDLQADLERLLERPVDLVVTRAIRNRYFLESVNRNRVVLYAA